MSPVVETGSQLFQVRLCVVDIISSNTSIQELRPVMSNHHQKLVNTVMKQFTTCRFNQKTQRFEATANGIKNIGYGGTHEEALALLRKLVDNNVRGRPELENLEEHEAYGQTAPASSPGSVTNVFHNVQGIINTGSISTMENVSLSLHQSIANLQKSDEDLAKRLDAFVKAVEDSDEIVEATKVEILDRADLITVEAAKPPEKRLVHRITDNVKGIAEVIKGCAAVKTVWDLAEPFIRSHFGI